MSLLRLASGNVWAQVMEYGTKFTAKCEKCGNPARRQSRPVLCGDCFMDRLKSCDEKLHDRIVDTNDSYSHRRKPVTEGTT